MWYDHLRDSLTVKKLHFKLGQNPATKVQTEMSEKTFIPWWRFFCVKRRSFAWIYCIATPCVAA
jgi:hypothetical protein